MDERDARLFHAANGRRGVFPAHEGDPAGIRGNYAGQYIHQRGFSGAVFAQQRVNFPRFNGEVNILQHRIAAESLRDVCHFQYCHTKTPLYQNSPDIGAKAGFDQIPLSHCVNCEFPFLISDR